MDILELSVMSYDVETSGLQEVLAEFEARHHVQVQITQLSWDTSWTQIVKYALYGDAPAVSEVGSTWVASLASMNALRPFTDQELSSLGGESAFLPAAWRSGRVLNDPTMWAIPWLAETRVIFYWRDMLKKASIDEQTAFQTAANLAQTLEHLQASGVPGPWCVPTQPNLTTFHNVASWIWGAGGDFLEQTEHRVIFHQDAARAGLRAYYDLYRFLPPDHRSLDAFTSDDLFLAGQTAATLSGPWLLFEQPLNLEVTEQIGVALPPGIPLVSESHLVIWRRVSP
jgi:multiple sugar transport system substrate-binding protein